MVKRIDPHVHFRDEELNYKETINHGLELARSQGVEYVFDMPNLKNPIFTEKDVLRRLSLVSKENMNRYFLYIGATCDEEQLLEAISLVQKYKEVIGIKMYAGQSTGNLAIIFEDNQQKIYNILAKNNYMGVLGVHCEKESFMKENLFDSKNPITHAHSRPNIAEIESIKDQIKFAKKSKFKGKIHICHISCKESINIVKEVKLEGLINLSCGVSPHHVLWDESKLNDKIHGLLYKMNPPLRSPIDVKYLRKSLIEDNVIDMIETDHAPHTIGEKLYGGNNSPSGFPTLYLYKDFVEKYLIEIGVSKEKIEKMTYDNIIKIFNLNLK